MEPDWDLHAVVRGFASISNTSTFTSTADHACGGALPSSKADVRDKNEGKKQNGFCSRNLVEELHELLSPYPLKPSQVGSVQPTISTYLAALEASKHKTTQQQQKGNILLGGTISTNSVPITPMTASDAAPHSQTTPKPKKRKFQLKKISHVPAKALSSDVWAWRKYGQKPIKGSPYPRGYYKCSSSKACTARKQVERNRSDPTMFIVTCTGEHNHPAPTHKNSLAGTTRNPNHPLSAALDESTLPTSKPSSSSSMDMLPTSKPNSSSSSMDNSSPAGSLDDEVLQQKDGVESNVVGIKGDLSMTDLVSDVLDFLDMDVSDDFFDSLGEISVTPLDSCFLDPIIPSFPSIASNATTTKSDRN